MRRIFKIILIILAIILLMILARFFMLGNTSKSGNPPGLISGRLSECPEKPNCVSSEFVGDESHYISPLSYPSPKSEEIMDLMKTIIQEVGGKITSEEHSYISATFTSSIFGFVDDLECRNDKSKYTIHLRSASRVGYSDLGANRKRVELISSIFINRVNMTNGGLNRAH